MKIELPENVELIITALKTAGYEAYAVGGCVRDFLLGREPDDWDITTSAKPEEVKELFDHTIDTGLQHGTVTVMLDHRGYEVTTYRIDGEYEDGRHPKEVTFTASLEEDLKRRDFTINAMAYNPDRGLVDLFGGQEDLAAGIIRCVGDARGRFSEDALRMLRAVRFSAQLGFGIERETGEAVREMAPTLSKVSAERIQVELVKLLVSDHPDRIRDAYELGLTAVFLPEFNIMMETDQINPHHIYTVGEHTIATLMDIPADRELRLTMLLHDVAKPDCLTLDEDGIMHFRGHPDQGAEKAQAILRRLKFDNATIRRVCHMVRWHDANPAETKKSVRRLMSHVGLEYYPMMFDIKHADIMGQNPEFTPEKLRRLEVYKQNYREIIRDAECVRIGDLAIGGRDLMDAGYAQGKVLGQILNYLLERVIEEPDLNNRDTLLELAGTYSQEED